MMQLECTLESQEQHVMQPAAKKPRMIARVAAFLANVEPDLVGAQTVTFASSNILSPQTEILDGSL
jgi:hypothetical protein